MSVSSIATAKTIDTLIPDIYALFDGHSIGEGIDTFAADLGNIFVQRFASYDEERNPTLRLSNIGRPLRQLWYEMHNAPSEALSPEAKFKFLYGDMIESLILFLALEAGHEVKALQNEVEIDGIKGHIDALIDGVLVDVKSASTYSFQKFASRRLLDDDPFGYVYQLSSYWAAVPEAKRAGFLVVDKTLGKLCFMELDDASRRSEPDVRERIATVREVVAGHDEPVRCYEDRPLSKTDKSGNRVLAVGCSYCRWKDHCWRDANNGLGLKTYFYSTGPKFFTHIEKEPRVPSQAHYEPDAVFPIREESELT